MSFLGTQTGPGMLSPARATALGRRFWVDFFGRNCSLRRMNPRIFSVIALLAATTGICAAQPDAVPVLNISADKVTAQFSPMLYGMMTEEINYCYDGGLYAELVRNRTFRNHASNAIHWQVIGDTNLNGMVIDDTEHMNGVLTRSLRVELGKADVEHPAGIANEGFWGIPVKPNTKYRASFYAKAG